MPGAGPSARFFPLGLIRMHFHLPKPVHGWRAFVGEIGIIVFGVLIALSAEQAVDAWHWSQRVAVVRNSIMRELGNDRARWEVNIAWDSCALREMDEVDRWAEGAPGRAAPHIPALLDPKTFWMHSASWTLATTSQTLAHFPIEEQLAFASLYDGIAHREAELEKESDEVHRVLSLIPLADDLSARRELRAALGELKGTIGELMENTDYMKRHFDAVGVQADRADFAAELSRPVCAREQSLPASHP